MKKLLLVSLTAFLLTACGNEVHENISQGMATDTESVIEIFDTTIKEERELNDREEKIFHEYEVNYGSRFDNPELAVEKLTEEERTLFILTQKMIEMYDHHTTLTSSQEDFKETKDRIVRVIETGVIDK